MLESSLVLGTWDLATLFQNTKTALTSLGGGLLGVLGVVAIVFAIVKGFVKLTSEQSRESWGRIFGIFVLGAVCIGGTLAIFIDMANGMKTTVDTLGGSPGLILPLFGG